MLTAFVRGRSMLKQDALYLSLAVEVSPDYRWLRQAAPADWSARLPLREVFALAAYMDFSRRATAAALAKAFAAKGTSVLLTVRWRLACHAMQLIVSLLRRRLVGVANKGFDSVSETCDE
jgi:hypothetical protein